MSGDWEVAKWADWVNNARLASDLVIVAAGVSVARVLWALLSRPNSKASATRAPRALVAFASLLALCGVSHLGVVLAGRTPAAVVPTALKVVLAGLWVVTAVRFRSVVAPLLNTPADPCRRANGHDARPAPCEGCALHGSAHKAARLRIKARALENAALDGTWLPDKSDALRELREILDDLEARPCQS